VPTSANQTGSMEALNSGSQLAQRIWDRYGYSLGVISLNMGQERVSHVARFSSRRLPLVAHLQQRWNLSEAPGSSDPVSAEHLQFPTINNVSRANVVGQASNGSQANVVSRTFQPLPETPVSEGLREAHSFGGKTHTEFEPAIIRRSKSRLTEPAIPRQVATYVPAPAAGDVPAHPENIPLPQPSAAPIGPTSQMQNPTPIKRGIGAPEKIVLQRHLSNPPEQPGPYQDSPREMSRLRLSLLERSTINHVVGATPMIQTRQIDAGPLDMPLATLAPTNHSTLIQARGKAASGSFAIGPSASAPASTHPSAETTGATDSSIEQNNNDEQDLVDRVLRQLMRRLTIEGERRGRQRWP
jgi:hypothetical protein